MSDNMVRTDSISTDCCLFYRPVFHSKDYGHTGYNRLIKIKTITEEICSWLLEEEVY